MPDGTSVRATQARLISRALSGGETDIAQLVYEVWPNRSREWRKQRRIGLYALVAKVHALVFLKIERMISREGNGEGEEDMIL
jgi:hypothetical protein